MSDRTKSMVLIAAYAFLSLSLRLFYGYKDAKLKSLYGENYYRIVYFVDEIRYNGVSLEL